MSDHHDYRENITYEKTVAQKNFVKKEEYDLQQLATEITLNSAKRRIKILCIVCTVLFLTIVSCLVSIFVIIGNGSNLRPVQDSPSHSSECLTRENEKLINGKETPVSFEEQIIAGRHEQDLRLHQEFKESQSVSINRHLILSLQVVKSTQSSSSLSKLSETSK